MVFIYFQWSEIGCLLNFIAQQISDSCLPCDTQLLEKVLNYLSMETIENESTRLHSERENAWYELLVNNCLQSISNDEEQLKLAKKARCFYVQEYLLEKLHRYDEILSCYISNPLRHEIMFVYMERYAKETNRKIYPQLKVYLKQLLEIDGKETTRIVDMYYRDKVDELLEILQDEEKILFIFLKQLQQRNDDLTPEQSEKLVYFLCKYEPSEVEEFLKACNCYRIEAALRLVTEYNLLSAAVFLAEKQNDYKTAFNFAMEILKSSPPEEMTECAKSVSALCSRSSLSSKSTQSEKGRESLWFELLQYILPLESLKSITKPMLHEASQHVDLASLVQLVMNTHNVSGNFGDIKELLLSMLNQSKAETNAMEIAMRILEKEVAEKLHSQHKQCSRGLLITMMQCVMCKQRLFNQSPIIIVGSCGHAMHVHCSIDFQKQHQQYDDVEDSPSTSSSSKNYSQQSNNLMEDDVVMQCPYCLCCIEEQKIAKPLQLAKPSHNVIHFSDQQQISRGITHMHTTSKELGVLHLKSPPRKF